MSRFPDDGPERPPYGPPRPNFKREIIGSVIGAVLGAAIAQVLAQNNREIIVSGAIAGSFVGPGLIVAAQRVWRSYQARGDMR